MATVYGNLLWQPWQTLSLLPPYIYCPSPQPYSTMAFMATVYGILQWQLWQSEIFYCLTSTAQVHSLTSSMAPMALVYGNLRWQLWQLDICYSLTSTTQVYILTSATQQESSNNSYYGTWQQQLLQLQIAPSYIKNRPILLLTADYLASTTTTSHPHQGPTRPSQRCYYLTSSTKFQEIHLNFTTRIVQYYYYLTSTTTTLLPHEVSTRSSQNHYYVTSAAKFQQDHPNITTTLHMLVLPHVFNEFRRKSCHIATTNIATVLQCMLQCLLQCVSVCCSVLQCVAVCCIVLQCVAVGHVGVWLYSVRAYCNTAMGERSHAGLLCVAVRCSVLQCMSQCVAVIGECYHAWLLRVAVGNDCCVLQYVWVCCSVLQREWML